jgi:hypothetical protein
MRIGRLFAVIAIATVCVMVFVQGGVAHAATSVTRHAARPSSPAPRHHGQAFGTTSTAPLQIVDVRFAPGVPATAV